MTHHLLIPRAHSSSMCTGSHPGNLRQPVATRVVSVRGQR